MEFKLKVLAPIMPNFIPFESPDKSKVHFPITDFSEKEAIEYGELMKQAFIDHWKKKKGV